MRISQSVLIAAAASTAVAWQAAISLSWGLAIDAPILAYSAFAMDRFGAVPYRDILDFNVPGAYLANLAIGRVFGFSELGLRLGDLTWLAALLAVTMLALRRFGWRTACAAPLLFGGFYLGYGPAMGLQREYLLLLPTALAVLLAFQDDRPVRTRALAIGLLIGIAATIKPHAALLLPVFGAWLLSSIDRARSRGVLVLVLTLGFVAPLLTTAAWLQATGALDAFLEMAANYWPLYNELSGQPPHRILQGSEWWRTTVVEFFIRRDARHLILIPAAVGVWLAIKRSALAPETRRQVWLLAGVAIALEVYPIAAGKFWYYHWLPSIYAASLLAALCFVPRPDHARVSRDLVPAMLVVMLMAQSPAIWRTIRQMKSDVARAPIGTAHRIKAALQDRLRPDDLVQPLDWTTGMVHGLLLAEARLATPFLYDFYFYHHVSNTYIQSLRRRFIDALETTRPAFIVAAARPRPLAGPDTDPAFVELSEILRRDYQAVVTEPLFVLYERNDRQAAR